MYKLIKKFTDKSPSAITSLPNGERVNLAGVDLTYEVEPTKHNPNTKKTIRGVKETELESLFAKEQTAYLLEYFNWEDDKGLVPASEHFLAKKK